MPEAISALPGAHYSGMIELAEAGPRGMIALRGDLALPALGRALQEAVGAEMPAQRRVSTGAKGAVAWMAPDELLIFVDYDSPLRLIASGHQAIISIVS